MEAIGSPFFTLSKRPTETFVNNPARGLERTMFSERASPTTKDGLTRLNQRTITPAMQRRNTMIGSMTCLKSCHFCSAGMGMGCLLLMN